MSSQGSYHFEVRAGRLIEIRMPAMENLEAAESFCAAFSKLKSRAPANGYVILADYRAVRVYPPEVADRLQRLMMDFNPIMERSALLTDPKHPIEGLQMSRIAKTSGHQGRRQFSDPEVLMTWLAEILTPEEQTRMRKFLGETS